MSSNKTTRQSSDKIWDRTFKTILQSHPSLFIALINLVFKSNYNKNISITNLNTETYNQDGSKIMSDTAFLINNITYHFECQFTDDDTMAFRMFEYDFHLALANVKRIKDFAEFNFPKSCVFYIVPKDTMPKSLSMKINFQDGGSYEYKVPVIRLFDYNLDKIEEMELYLFLPYEILRHIRNVTTPKHIAKYSDEILKIYNKIIIILKNAYSNAKLTKEEILTLLTLISDTAEYKLKNNYMEIWKGVNNMLNTEYLPKWKLELEEEKNKEAISAIHFMKNEGIPDVSIRKFAHTKNIKTDVLEQILKEDTNKTAQA